MKSTTKTPKMERKLIVPVLGSPVKTMGSGKKDQKEVKVHRESPPRKSLRPPRLKFSSPVHQYVRRIQADPDSSLSSELAGSLLNLNTSYMVRMAQQVTVQSTVGGVVQFSEPVDPSAAGQNFAEYSTWTTLFNQVRVKSFKITIAPIRNTVTLGANYPGIVASCLTTLGVPTSAVSLAENADSVLYAWNVLTKPLVHSVKFHPLPLWADITTPDPGDNIGTPGCIMGYFDGLTASTDCFRMLVEGIYEFRSRT